MRILIATGIFKPELGGPATVALELGKRLQATGHRVSVITFSDKSEYDFDKDFAFKLTRVVRRGGKLLNYWRYFRAVLGQINKYDVVYTLDWFSGGFPVMLAAKLTGKKYIVRVGGGYLWEKYLSEGKPPVTLKEFYARRLYKGYKLMFFIIKRVLKNAQYVVFNSQIQRELYETVYALLSQKTLTIFNAIPENRLSGLVQSFNAGEYVRRDKEIVFAGRFIKMKNIESLIRAFAKIGDTSFRLLLIGDGPTAPLLHALVDELSISDRVEFLPAMSQSDLYRRIAHCHMVVIPSWTDVAPNQAYECLALGIPVLITKENYLEIATSFKTTIDPASIDDIKNTLAMLMDEKKYQQFVAEQKAIPFDHPWARVVEEHIHLFMKSIKHE